MCALSVACFAYARKKSGQCSINLALLTKIVARYLELHNQVIKIHQCDAGINVSIRNELWHELSSHALTYHPKVGEHTLRIGEHTSRGDAHMDDVVHALEAVHAYGITTGQYKLTFEFSKRNIRKFIATIDAQLITRH